MGEFSTRYGGYYGSSSSGWDSRHWSERDWDKEELEETDWWKRRQRKTYSSRLGFGSSDHRSYYSGSYSFSTSTRDYYSKEFGKDHARKVEILQKAYSNSRDLVNILPFPNRLNIYYDKNGFTRNKHNHDLSTEETNIYITLDCMAKVDSSTTIEEEEKIIRIFTGNSLHEASHLLNTEFTPTIRFFGEGRYVSAAGKFLIPDSTDYMIKFLTGCFGKNILDEDSLDKFTIAKTIINTLYNAIEGERVDVVMLEERQGWGEFFEEYKNFLYESIYPGDKYSKPSNKKKINFIEFFYTLLKFIRFPDKISDGMMEKYSTPLEQSKKWIVSNSTLTSCMNAFSLFKFILLNILKHSGEESMDGLEKDLLKPPTEDVLEGLDSALSVDLLSKLKDMNNSGFTSAFSGFIVVNSRDPKGQFMKNNAIRSTIFGSKGPGNVLDENYLDIITNEIEGSISNKVFFYKPAGDPGKYESEKTIISPYILSLKNLVRNVNKNYEFTIHGQRNGKLDTDKLAEAYQGISHVYIRKGRVNTSGMTVCVVIDESGSMGGERCILARRAGILLNEAFGHIPGIDMYIYGHTADEGTTGSTEIYTYREPGMRYVSGKVGCGLSNSTARYENRDGTALLEIAKRVRKFTQNPVLMFILSDGNPSAQNYRGTSAIRDTAEKVKKIEAMGFFPIQVNICNSCCDSAQMFKTWVDLTNDINELPKKLGVVVRNELVKLMNASRTVTQV